ncbi:MAG: hypothetical protein ACLTBS_12870 [Eisenbergiella sp.]
MKKDSLWGICLWAAMISTAFLFAGCGKSTDTAESAEISENILESAVVENDAVVSENDMEVLKAFARIFEQSISDGKIPDLSGIYGRSTQQSKENMETVAEWMSQPYFDRDDDEISCYSDLEIESAETDEGNIRKVVFYLKHSIYRNGLHDVASGCRITAYIADEKESAQNKSVIVKLSGDDVSFELIKQRAQSDGKD